MKKVNLQVIKPWIAKKVTELVGFDDEVVVEYAMGLLEDPNHTVSLTFSFRRPYMCSFVHAYRHPTPKKCKST